MGDDESAVYAIVNTRNGKVYVGSTVNVRIRFAAHQRDLRKGVHRNRRLQHAFNQDGAEAFAYRVLEAVSDPAQLAAREQEWFERLNCCDESAGYNLITNAEHRTHSAETRERMRAAHTGKIFTTKHRANLAAARRGRPGQPLTAQQRAAISERQRGRTTSPETRAKISAAQKGRPGKPNSPDARAKISAANKDRPKSPEHRAKIGAAHRGRPLPPEQRERLAALQRNRSPETRAKLSAANGRLTVDQVREIRARAAQGEGVCMLAREFGVSHATVSDAVHRRTWKHLP